MKPRGACIVRRGSGYLHLAIPLRRGYDTACCKPFDTAAAVWHGRSAETAWRKKAWFRCPDCAYLIGRGWPTIRRITNW